MHTTGSHHTTTRTAVVIAKLTVAGLSLATFMFLAAAYFSH
jgi:hypothetical protein